MGLLHHLETQLERQIPAQLQAALQQALDDYQPLCDHCPPGHAPPPPLCARHCHRLRRVRVQIPVFRCGQCRRMVGGMTPLGDEMRHQRFSKRTVTSLSVWPRRD